MTFLPSPSDIDDYPLHGTTQFEVEVEEWRTRCRNCGEVCKQGMRLCGECKRRARENLVVQQNVQRLRELARERRQDGKVL